MCLWVCLVFLSLAIVGLYNLYRREKFSKKLEHLPGPKGVPYFGNGPSFRKPREIHKVFQKFATEYGSLYRIRMGFVPMVILSGYDSIHELMITKGKDASGRYGRFRIRYALKDTGILFSWNADKTWKTLRKVSHTHFKQFGEGMTRLENIISSIADDMFDVFAENVAKPLDPKRAIFDTALKNIAFLITGEKLHSNDELLALMEEYEPLFMKYIVSMSPIKHAILDGHPWLRYFGLGSWDKICRFVELEDIIWKDVKKRYHDNPEQASLVGLLMSHVENENSSEISEVDAKRSCISLLLAGVTTTSSSFYSLVNILAHYQDVQQKVADEIRKVIQPGKSVTLDDKLEMPYTRAVIYELLRYFPVVQTGVGRRTTKEITIQGHRIPRNCPILTSIWALHHDKAFWKDPEIFRPERFLDTSGDLLPADHPNRKHLIPFGMGSRVCLGESMALARLFLWTAIMIQRFKVHPAPGNTKLLVEPDSYYCDSVLYSMPYEVRFERRI